MVRESPNDAIRIAIAPGEPKADSGARRRDSRPLTRPTNHLRLRR